MRQLWALQYVRAFAAVGVVIFHVLEGTTHPMPVGAAGVDVFFVLSGFLMFALTSRRPTTPGRFMLDRVIRIVPLYWLATVTTFVAARASHNGIHLVGRSTTLLLQSLLFVPRGPATVANAAYPTLFVGWTLDFEMFFYVLFALALALGGSPLRRILLMTAVFGGLVAFGRLAPPRDCTLAAATNPIILEFLEGSWLAALFTARDSGRIDGRTLLFGLLAVVAAPVALHALPRSLFALLAVSLVAAAIVLERARLVPMVGWLRFLGDASYSIYLFQILAFQLADFVLFHAGRLSHLPGEPATRSLCEIAAAIGLGCAAHVAVERPLLRCTRQVLARRAGLEPRIAGAS